jgi:hypothetical protein
MKPLMHLLQERAFLSKIASAVGPVPSTQGQAQCEAAVTAQRKAIDMLAESDRHGCAVGAAIALTLDWRTIRVLLDISAQRLDLSPPTCTLPDLRETARLAATVADYPGCRARHGVRCAAADHAAQRALGSDGRPHREPRSTPERFRLTPCPGRLHPSSSLAMPA